MNSFNEQVVKKATKPKNIIIKIITVMLLFLVPAVIFILAFVITAYLVYVSFFVFLGGIYVVWYVFGQQKVEFEYSVSGSDLKIAKVVSLRKRKSMCTVPIGDIASLEKSDAKTRGVRFMKTFIAARDIDADEENYYAVFNSPAYGKCLLVFSPNDNILTAMKPHLNSGIVIDLFYGKGRR